MFSLFSTSFVSSVRRFAPTLLPTAVTPVTAVTAATAALLGLACLAPGAARAQTTVEYSNLGTFTQNGTFTRGGITVTTQGTFGFTDQGLGIQGGTPVFGVYPVIDNGETALFTFDNGPVTGLTVIPGAGFSSGQSTPTTIEAFGSANNSLGVFNFDTSNVSNQFGSSISAFRITGGTNSGSSIYSITFTPSAVVPPSTAAPEPGSLALLLPVVGVAGMALRKRKTSK